jgi:hypothetical protein
MNTLKASVDAIETPAAVTSTSNLGMTPIQRIVSRRLSLSSNDRIISEKHLMKMIHRGTTPEYFGNTINEIFLIFRYRS